jgi:hypothetical protein
VRNPLPRRYRRPLGNAALCILIYLALTGLHAMIDGRAPAPSLGLIVAFVIGSAIGVWINGLRDEDEA